MHVGSIADQRIVAIDRETALAYAKLLMHEYAADALAVMADDGEDRFVSGMVTRHDIAGHALTSGQQPCDVKVGALLAATGVGPRRRPDATAP